MGVENFFKKISSILSHPKPNKVHYSERARTTRVKVITVVNSS